MSRCLRRFIDAVTEKAIGQDVLKSVTPGQQVVKVDDDWSPCSLDVNRPAAAGFGDHSLQVLGEQVDVPPREVLGEQVCRFVEGQQPVDIARRAMEAASLQICRRAAARYRGPPACR